MGHDQRQTARSKVDGKGKPPEDLSQAAVAFLPGGMRKASLAPLQHPMVVHPRGEVGPGCAGMLAVGHGERL